MELDQIMCLIDAMNERGITKLGLKTGDYELNLERGEVVEASSAPIVMTEEKLTPAVAAPPAAAAAPIASNHKTIQAPVVGTLYLAPSPEAESFVQVGDTVTPDTVVAIVEAMKVMNEVRAGIGGVIASTLCANGEPVEFGTPLFEVQ